MSFGACNDRVANQLGIGSSFDCDVNLMPFFCDGIPENRKRKDEAGEANIAVHKENGPAEI